MKFQHISYFLSLLLLTSSCVPYESLVNYNENPPIPTAPQEISNYQPITIQPNDILYIKISSLEEAAEPFELNSSQGRNANNNQALLLDGYIVTQEGYIDFPTLGKVKLNGLTIEEAKEHLLEKMNVYFETLPIVNIRLLNFNINVNGEVNSPGALNVPTERITILEAVTLAGDFTDYSRRDSILIIRESNGARTFGYVNFNSPNLFNSPYFYLQQNDVIYIRPLQRKIAVVRDPINQVFTWASAGIGITGFVLSLTRRR